MLPGLHLPAMNKLHILVIVGSITGALQVARQPTAEPAAAPTPAKHFYSAPNAWSKDEVLAARDGGNWRGEVRLDRHSDGHFYAEALVKGVPVHAVVDTGASVVALTGEDARKVGLSWNESEVEPIGRGASGTVYGVIRRVDSINVGGIMVRDLEVMVIPTGLDVTLLGQNFLNRATSVEMRGGQMVLSNL